MSKTEKCLKYQSVFELWKGDLLRPTWLCIFLEDADP
jgi:hypothetical protein